MRRRTFLCSATAAVGGGGLIISLWPFLDQMNPDAKVRAAGDIVEVSIVDLRPAQQRIVCWHGWLISIVKRTTKMLEAMQDQKLSGMFRDPLSEGRQQPSYAKNWYRSIKPEYAVLVGVCTYCRCIPHYFADEPSQPDMAGGYVCPCCASRFDPAGRVYYGPAQFNLPVPPYDLDGQSRIRIGRNASDALFSIETIEQI